MVANKATREARPGRRAVLQRVSGPSAKVHQAGQDSMGQTG